MLRMIFVLGIVAVGITASAFGPFNALLFYLWNAYFRPEQWTYGPFIGSLRFSLIIGTYLVVRTVASLPDLQINLRTSLILLFLAQSILGVFTSEHPIWSSAFLSDFWKVLLISYLIVVLVTDRERLRLTILVIALSLGFECAKQGWVSLFRAPGAKNDNPIPFLGDNNGVALGTMMLVPLFGALAQTAAGRWEKLTHRFLGVGVFLRGFTTYSRGGFLAAAVLGLFTLVRSPRRIRALIGLAAIVGLVWMVMPQSYWDRMHSIAAPEGQLDVSAAGRLHFWQVAIDMAGAKPLTGVGLNGFEKSYERYNTGGEYAGVRATHSTWLGVLADLGVPGFLMFVASWILAVWACWRVAAFGKDDPAQGDLRAYANALITSLFAYAAAGTFLSAQYNEMIWHFFGLTAALYAIAKKLRTSPNSATTRPRAAQPMSIAS
jgi:probable O-glycosylation ligase (exosortase A-associated)